MRKHPIVACLALVALAATPARAADACVPEVEAEALVLTLAPAAIASAATVCAPALPATAFLRTRTAQLSAKFAVEADRAWPQARAALKRIAGPDSSALLDSDLARPMAGAMFAPLIVKDLKPAHCPRLSKVLGLMEPLPARNAAALLVAGFEIAQTARRTDQPRAAFTICEIATRQQ